MCTSLKGWLDILQAATRVFVPIAIFVLWFDSYRSVVPGLALAGSVAVTAWWLPLFEKVVFPRGRDTTTIEARRRFGLFALGFVLALTGCAGLAVVGADLLVTAVVSIWLACCGLFHAIGYLSFSIAARWDSGTELIQERAIAPQLCTRPRWFPIAGGGAVFGLVSALWALQLVPTAIAVASLAMILAGVILAMVLWAR